MHFLKLQKKQSGIAIIVTSLMETVGCCLYCFWAHHVAHAHNTMWGFLSFDEVFLPAYLCKANKEISKVDCILHNQVDSSKIAWLDPIPYD